MLTPFEPWQNAMEHAMRLYIEQTALMHGAIHEDHVRDTPKRATAALAYYASGCKEDPAQYLQTTFPATYNQMIHRIVPIVSMCAHHLAAIAGKVHFAYVPDGRIVGLSKISRFIKVLTKRPQVQEQLAEQIVDVFQDALKPIGCAVNIRAYHFCMIARGIEEPATATETTSLRGAFLSNVGTRDEFMASINRDELVFP